MLASWFVVVLVVISLCTAIDDGMTQVVTVENCSDAQSVPHFVVSGSCTVDHQINAGSRFLTCLNSTDMCVYATLFNDDQCESFVGEISLVCNRCLLLGNDPPFYAIAKCDSSTQQVEWSFNCNMGCTMCLDEPEPSAPLSCSSLGLGLPPSGGQWAYVQGTQSCAAVEVTAFSSPNCSGPSVTTYVAQYDCGQGEWMSCDPQGIDLLPPVASYVIYAEPSTDTVSARTSCTKATVALPLRSCVSLLPLNATWPMLPSGAASLTAYSVEMPSTCADIALYNETSCSQAIASFTPVCGTCMWLGSGYVLVGCNASTKAVIIAVNCDPTCTTCGLPGKETFAMNICSNTSTGGAVAALQRGLYPCNTVSYDWYSSDDCEGTVLSVSVVATDQCSINGLSTYFSPYVAVTSCTSPNAEPQTSVPGSCSPGPSGSFLEYDCLNGTNECLQLSWFSANECGGAEENVTFVCDQCAKMVNPSTGNATYASFSCDWQNQLVTIASNCNASCMDCTNMLNISTTTCTTTEGLFGSGSATLRALSPCNGVVVSVFDSDQCSSTSLRLRLPVAQDVCLPFIGSAHCVTAANVVPPPATTTTTTPTATVNPATSEAPHTATSEAPHTTTTVNPATSEAPYTSTAAPHAPVSTTTVAPGGAPPPSPRLSSAAIAAIAVGVAVPAVVVVTCVIFCLRRSSPRKFAAVDLDESKHDGLKALLAPKVDESQSSINDVPRPMTYVARLVDVTDPTAVPPPFVGFKSTPMLSLAKAMNYLENAKEGALRDALKDDGVDSLQWWVDEAIAYGSRTWASLKDKSLSPDEIAVIHLYTMESPLYRALNHALRSQDRNLIKSFFPCMKLLLSALCKLPREATTVFRGVRLDPLPLHLYAKGTTVTWWGFSSCTKSVDVLKNPQFLGDTGSRLLFSVQTKHAVSVTAFSASPTEAELLLLPGTKLCVVGVLRLAVDCVMIQLEETGAPQSLLLMST